MQNYLEPAEPLFQADYAPVSAPRLAPTSLKIVTWNIQFGENVAAAIDTLQTTPALVDADILLLQEMDEAGTDAIARALAYNYIYFPASRHAKHGRNFGNAILTPWPLSHPQKIVLPHRNPRNGQQRTATRGVVRVGAATILTYSVHTETFWLGPKQRSAQVETLADTVTFHYDYVVAGGDFNTLTGTSIAAVDELMARRELVRLSAEAGHTVAIGKLRLMLDHIYGSDVPVIDRGVWRTTDASDHYPLWVIVGAPAAAPPR